MWRDAPDKSAASTDRGIDEVTRQLEAFMGAAEELEPQTEAAPAESASGSGLLSGLWGAVGWSSPSPAPADSDLKLYRCEG